MDIIYPYLKGDDEIIYSLRSLANLPHSKVFIVGDRPEGIDLKKVCYIPFAQTKTKYKNTTDIIKMMCNNSAVSDDFILMNDDFFILKPITKPKEELNLYRGNAFNVYEHYVQKYGNNGYSKGMLETAKCLQNIGIENPLGYELHIPFIFNKNKFLQMYKDFGAQIEQINCFHKRTFYGNLYNTGGTSIKDVKIFAFGGLPAPEQKFLSCSDTAWANLRVYMQKIFNTKSIYEV